jgi:capsular polysaccharide biosynthesis protein
MNPEDAEEYTQGLGQIVAGARRQMEEAARLGVPQALGLSASEWVETRLGASSGTDASQRREPIKELAQPRNGAATGGQHQRKRLSRLIPHAGRKQSRTAADEAELRPNLARIRLRHSPRHWLVIPICGVLGMLGGLIWTAATPAIYQSQAAAFISMTALPANDPNHNDPFGSSQFALQRVQTYAQLATSPQVLQGAMRDLHRGEGVGIGENVKVGSSGGVMLWVTVEDGDAQTAAHTADAVMASLVRSVAALEADGGQRSPVQLVPVQPALVPNKPAGRGGLIKSLLGLLVGLGLGGTAFHFIRSRRDGKHHRSLGKDTTGNNTEPASAEEADPGHRDSGVVVLRVGDGRDFSRRVGR